MRATIYCRVSSEDQKREGTSLDSQREACRKLAHDHGYEVTKEHTEKIEREQKLSKGEQK